MKTYLTRPASSRRRQEPDYTFPPTVSWDNPIVGVSEQDDEVWFSYQFIFADGSRSEASEWDCPENWWRDLHVPSGDAIASVESMHRKFDGLLMGLKFVGRKGETLAATELIDKLEFRRNRYVAFRRFVLKENERLVGVKSGQRGESDARHHDL
jgi:hypothetical protein